jgi:capsular polysaccharide transport system ATP-binding protein
MIELSNVYKFYTTLGMRKVVLDHVSTKFEAGWSYGMLGVNGAGKSTTLRLLAGTETANAGKIKRSVRISWPLGFSGGFHPGMTGRENVYFVSRIYGQDPRKISRWVEDFAEIGEYIDRPVKTYSSGMMARLAFGLSMAIDFDCYLIDEVTAVGDGRFAARCKEVFDRRREHTDIIMVSHSISTVKEHCQRGAVLVDGRLLMFDDVDEAIGVYNRLNR